MPCRLLIDLDCLMILRTSLEAVAPEEGCALLLGDAMPECRIRQVWPCCNVWRPGLIGFSEDDPVADGVDAPSASPSRRSRFAVDPREQFAAQRWARRHRWQVIGSAHSHPQTDPVPSAVDRRWAVSEGVMVIDSGTRGIAAWWLHEAARIPAQVLPMLTCSEAVDGAW